MQFDEVLEKIGEFGPYQKRIYFLVSLIAVVAAYQAMSPVFLLEMTAYRCKLPSYDNDTYAIQSPHHEYLINLTVPTVVDSQGKTTYSECYLNNVTNQRLGDNSNYSQYKCNEWVYDDSVTETTAFTDFNMVCEDEIYRSHSNMINFAGSLVGAIVFGSIGDILGRKKALMLSVLFNCISNVAMSLTTHYTMFAVFNFVIGCSEMGMFMLAFVLALEIVGPSHRTMAGMIIEIFWSAGLFILTGLAYFIRQWRNLRLALGIPSVLIIAYWWLIPESPRWLVSRRKMQEATRVVRKIAKSNGVEMDETLLDEMVVDDSDENQVKIWQMFTNPTLVLRSFVIFFNWFAINIVYYGLSLNVGNLSGDIYLNFFLSSLMELAAFIITLILLNKVGRKTLHVVSMVLGGLACLASIFPVIYGDKSTEWMIIALTMAGKLGATTAFAVIYIYTVELFPTVVRQSAVGSCSFCEGIAGMVAPYIADLGILVKGPLEAALPLIVFGCLTIAAGCMALLLPETRDQKLPETLKDAISFGRPNTIISNDRRNQYQNITLITAKRDDTIQEQSAM